MKRHQQTNDSYLENGGGMKQRNPEVDLVEWARKRLSVPRSSSTLRTYRSEIQRLKRAKDAVGISKNGRTRSVQRAALRHYLAQEIVSAHEAGDKATLSSLGRIKQRIDDAALAMARRASGGGADNQIRKKSKKVSLRGLPQYWRATFLDHASGRYGRRPTKYYAAIAILAASGCRPSELEIGVHVGPDETGENLVFTIRGTKVTDENGHALRIVKVAGDTPLSQRVVHGFIQAGAKALNDAVVRIGKIVFPGRGPDRQVSPYSFRHAIAGDFKGSGSSEAEVSAALGHRSTETKALYGRSRRAGGQRLISVAVEDEVREYPKSTVPETLRAKRTRGPREK